MVYLFMKYKRNQLREELVGEACIKERGSLPAKLQFFSIKKKEKHFFQNFLLDGIRIKSRFALLYMYNWAAEIQMFVI